MQQGNDLPKRRGHPRRNAATFPLVWTDLGRFTNAWHTRVGAALRPAIGLQKKRVSDPHLQIPSASVGVWSTQP